MIFKLNNICRAFP